MKFCKDCRHAEHAIGQWFCRHPVAGWHRGVDVVTGEGRNQEVPCRAARRIGECGYDPPRFWEAKGGGVEFVP